MAKMLAVLAANYGIELTTMRRQAYELGLSDLPMDALAKAGMRALQESKFMPTVAELREMAGTKRTSLAPVPDYLKPAQTDDEILCKLHQVPGNERVPVTDSPWKYWWCRTCKRIDALTGQRGGPPTQLGELLATFGAVEAVNDK